MGSVEKIIERISEYDLLNCIIPGAIYVVVIERITYFTISVKSFFVDLIIYYFVGVVIGRLGSLLIEPVFSKCKMIKRTPYVDYLECVSNNKRLHRLNTINNMYRTYIALFLSILLTYGFGHLWMLIGHFTWSGIAAKVVIILALILLFSFSYIKQTSYISGYIESKNKHPEGSILIPSGKGDSNRQKSDNGKGRK